MAPARFSSSPPSLSRRGRRSQAFAGLIGRIFPSSRPGQGGTLPSLPPSLSRARAAAAGGEGQGGEANTDAAETDSAYRDLGIDPDQLTTFNIAGDEPPNPEALLTGSAGVGGAGVPPSEEHYHRRGWRWSSKRNRRPSSSRFVEDLLDDDEDDDGGNRKSGGRSPTTPRTTTPTRKQQESAGDDTGKGKGKDTMAPASGQDSPLPKNEITRKPVPIPTSGTSLSPEQQQQHDPMATSELLRAREEVRRARRSLKESGDWLGVQGADPWTGEPAVLTPTETVSSDGTTASAGRRLLERLAGHRRAAEHDCDRVRRLEAEAYDRVRADRERDKLQKIDRRKEDARVRLLQDADGGGGGDGTVVRTRWRRHRDQWSSIAEPNLSPIAQSVNSGANNIDERPSSSTPVKAIPNFSRPIQPHETPRYGSSPAHVRGQSTDTIVHNAPYASGHDEPSARPSTLQDRIPEKIQDPGPSSQSHQGKHFLWGRRRRMTDPEGQDRSPATDITPATDTTWGSDERPRTNHFMDLVIPDYHLHLVSPEPEEKPGKPSSPTDRATTPSPPELPGQGGSAEQAQNPDRHLTNGHYTNAATVISYQSKSKRPMKPHSARRNPIPSQWDPHRPVNGKETPRSPWGASRSLDAQRSYADRQLFQENGPVAPPVKQQRRQMNPRSGMVRHSVDDHRKTHAALIRGSRSVMELNEKYDGGRLPSEGTDTGTSRNKVRRSTSSPPGPSVGGRKSASTPTTTITGCDHDRDRSPRSCGCDREKAPTPPPWAMRVFQTEVFLDGSSDDPATLTSSSRPQPSAAATSLTEEEIVHPASRGPRLGSLLIPPRRSSLSSAPDPGTRETGTTSTRAMKKSRAIRPRILATARSAPSLVARKVVRSRERGATEVETEREESEEEERPVPEIVVAGDMTFRMISRDMIKVKHPLVECVTRTSRVDQRRGEKQEMKLEIIPIVLHDLPPYPVSDEVGIERNSSAEIAVDGATDGIFRPQPLSPDMTRVPTTLHRHPIPAEHTEILTHGAARTAVIWGRAKKMTARPANSGHQSMDGHETRAGGPAATTSTSSGNVQSTTPPANNRDTAPPKSQSLIPVKKTPLNGELVRANGASGSEGGEGTEKERALQLTLRKKLEDEIQRQIQERRARPLPPPPSLLPPAPPQHHQQFHRRQDEMGPQTFMKNDSNNALSLSQHKQQAYRQNGRGCVEGTTSPPPRFPPRATDPRQTQARQRAGAGPQIRTPHQQPAPPPPPQPPLQTEVEGPGPGARSQPLIPTGPLSRTGMLLPHRRPAAVAAAEAAVRGDQRRNAASATASTTESAMGETVKATSSINTATTTTTITTITNRRQSSAPGRKGGGADRGSTSTTTVSPPPHPPSPPLPTTTTTTTTTTATAVTATLLVVVTAAAAVTVCLSRAALLLLCAGGRAWWAAARPAFDPASGVRRRQRARRATPADLRVLLLAAGLLCAAAAAATWCAGQLLACAGALLF